MKIRHDMVSCHVVRPSQDGSSHEYLQLRRAQNDFMGGTWQAIYGTSEAAESPVQAVLRELREEAGLIPIELYRVDQVSVFYIAENDTLWHCVPFCAIVDRAIKITLNDEHEASRWVPAKDVAAHFMWQDNFDAIERIETQILKNSLAKPFLRIPLG
jgi:8-oxo-dGTP pyrophosphatase MutT (NUDIX family)